MESNLIRDLETIIDKEGIAKVLETLAEMCYLKQEHVASNWQDTTLAKSWGTLGYKLGALSAWTDGRIA